jgi:hypothetical protein
VGLGRFDLFWSRLKAGLSNAKRIDPLPVDPPQAVVDDIPSPMDSLIKN